MMLVNVILKKTKTRDAREEHIIYAYNRSYQNVGPNIFMNNQSSIVKTEKWLSL